MISRPSRCAFALLLSCFLLAAGAAVADRSTAPRTVIALLVDGLSGEMIGSFETPNLDRLRAEGASSHEFVPTFPAISGPTWVSIATGCWPENHGIVTDKFLDPELGLMDHASDVRWLSGCELIQQVAERQGIETAALGWWGQWSASSGPSATHVSANARLEQQAPRDPTVFLTDPERAAEVVDYLTRGPEERPRLILAYFRGPDHDAHFHGIQSPETQQAVVRFDAALGTVLAAIDDQPDREHIALIVMSDHGMVPIHHVVNVRRILRRHDIEARDVTTGTTAFLYFENKRQVLDAKKLLDPYTEFEVFLRNELPSYAHLGNGERVPDLVLAARPGYYTADPDVWPLHLRPLTRWGPDFVPSPILGGGVRAAHGYAPRTPGNDGVIYGWGSGIRGGVALGSVRMIDVHPTITTLLGIEAGRPVDGTAERRMLGQEQAGQP